MFEYTKTRSSHTPYTRPIWVAYLSLIKPGIVLGNIFALVAGFFLALSAHASIPYYFLLLWLVLGSCCVITAACIINNCIDYQIDKLMLRTQKRAIPSGEASRSVALGYGFSLLVLGIVILYWHVNIFTCLLGVLGFFIYVILYSIALKKHSEYAILIGSLSGAIPPVMGYSALSPNLDMSMFLLFIMFTSWQIPHSYAIAIFRQKDYERAYIPVYPAKHGFQASKRQSLFFIALFFLSSSLLFWHSYASYLILVANVFACVYWVYYALIYKAKSHEEWGRKTFIASIQVITFLCLLMIL